MAFVVRGERFDDCEFDDLGPGKYIGPDLYYTKKSAIPFGSLEDRGLQPSEIDQVLFLNSKKNLRRQAINSMMIIWTHIMSESHQ